MFRLLLFHVCVALSAHIVPGHGVSFKSQCGSLPGGVTHSASGRDRTSLGFVKPKRYHKVLPGSRVRVRSCWHSGGDSGGVKVMGLKIKRSRGGCEGND